MLLEWSKVGSCPQGDPCQFGVPQPTGPRITLCPAALSSAAVRVADRIDVADEPGAAVGASENDDENPPVQDDDPC